MMKRMGSKAGAAGLKAMMGGLGGGGGMPSAGGMPQMDPEAMKKMASQLPQGMGGQQLFGKAPPGLGGLGGMPGLGGLPSRGGKPKRKK